MADRPDLGPEASARANRIGWDAYAREYLTEHSHDLGGTDGIGFIWGPEGLSEQEARFLGPSGGLRGRRVLEVGAGAGQCSRWLAAHEGALCVASDISADMVAAGRELAQRVPVENVAYAEADAGRLPVTDESFDLIFTAHGGYAFLPDLLEPFREAHRVLRPSGRFVFSLPHPIRWMFPDAPGVEGLTAMRSYFDSEPYAEFDDNGTVVYVEHHHTLDHTLTALIDAGFVLDLCQEIRWPKDRNQQWGGWGPVTGAIYPRTLVLGGRKL